MKLLQKILVALDFEPASVKVLEAAMELGNKFLSEITLLHVIPGDLPQEAEKFITRQVTARISDLTQRVHTEGVKSFSFRIEKGIPFERIIEVAEKEECNLVVAGAGNPHGVNQFKLGTTVEKLLFKNQVPVFVVHPEGLREVKKIMCPVDFSESSKRALVNAIFLSNRFGAELTLLHVFEPVRFYSYRITVNETEENQKMKAFRQEEFDAFLKPFHLNRNLVRVMMKEGYPEQVILEEIQKQETALLVMGTTGKTGLSRILLGSVTEKVTREVPCSFLLAYEAEISAHVFESNLKIIESLIISGRAYLQSGETDKAIEKFIHVHNQYPDNIPALFGLVRCFSITGNKAKAQLYRRYARQVLDRIWGPEFGNLPGLIPGDEE